MKEETHYGVCILLEDIIYTHYQENLSSLCSKINDLATKKSDERLQVFNMSEFKETKAFSTLAQTNCNILLFKPLQNGLSKETIRIFVVYHPLTQCGLIVDVPLKSKKLHKPVPRLQGLTKCLNNDNIFSSLDLFIAKVNEIQALKQESDTPSAQGPAIESNTPSPQNKISDRDNIFKSFVNALSEDCYSDNPTTNLQQALLDLINYYGPISFKVTKDKSNRNQCTLYLKTDEKELEWIVTQPIDYQSNENVTTLISRNLSSTCVKFYKSYPKVSGAWFLNQYFNGQEPNKEIMGECLELSFEEIQAYIDWMEAHYSHLKDKMMLQMIQDSISRISENAGQKYQILLLHLFNEIKNQEYKSQLADIFKKIIIDPNLTSLTEACVRFGRVTPYLDLLLVDLDIDTVNKLMRLLKKYKADSYHEQLFKLPPEQFSKLYASLSKEDVSLKNFLIEKIKHPQDKYLRVIAFFALKAIFDMDFPQYEATILKAYKLTHNQGRLQENLKVIRTDALHLIENMGKSHNPQRQIMNESSFLDSASCFGRWAPLMSHLSDQYSDNQGDAYKLILNVFNKIKQRKTKLHESQFYTAKSLVASNYFVQFAKLIVEELENILDMLNPQTKSLGENINFKILNSFDDFSSTTKTFPSSIEFSARFSAKSIIFENFYKTFTRKINALSGYDLGALFVHLYHNDFQFKEGFWLDNIEFIELFFERFFTFLPEDPVKVSELLNLTDQEKEFIISLCCISSKIFHLVNKHLSNIFDRKLLHEKLDKKLKTLGAAFELLHEKLQPPSTTDELILSKPNAQNNNIRNSIYHTFNTYKENFLKVYSEVSMSPPNNTLIQNHIDFYCDQISVICDISTMMSGIKSFFLCWLSAIDSKMYKVLPPPPSEFLSKEEFENLGKGIISNPSLTKKNLLQAGLKNYCDSSNSDWLEQIKNLNLLKTLILQKLNSGESSNYLECKRKDGVVTSFKMSGRYMHSIYKDLSKLKDKKFYFKLDLDELKAYYASIYTSSGIFLRHKSKFLEKINSISERVIDLLESLDIEERQAVLCRYAYKDLIIDKKNYQADLIFGLHKLGYPCKALIIAGFDRTALSYKYTMQQIRDAEKKLNIEPMPQTITETCGIS